MEKQDTPVQSRKFRVLVVRESFFEDMKKLDVDVDSTWGLTHSDRSVIDPPDWKNRFKDDRLEKLVGYGAAKQSKSYLAYKRNRLKILQTLKRLYDAQEGQKVQLFLVGSLLIPALEPHPEEEGEEGGASHSRRKGRRPGMSI
eukprot:COSAG01_NODE_2093_length_8443_cov_351.385307_5_plen_143_part_00